MREKNKLSFFKFLLGIFLLNESTIFISSQPKHPHFAFTRLASILRKGKHEDPIHNISSLQPFALSQYEMHKKWGFTSET